MTTKDQERQAIEEIRKIVEGLGENSYVGFAMEGVLELAEENIREDTAYSMKRRAEIAEEQRVVRTGMLRDISQTVDRSRKGNYAACAASGVLKELHRDKRLQRSDQGDPGRNGGVNNGSRLERHGRTEQKQQGSGRG